MKLLNKISTILTLLFASLSIINYFINNPTLKFFSDISFYAALISFMVLFLIVLHDLSLILPKLYKFLIREEYNSVIDRFVTNENFIKLTDEKFKDKEVMNEGERYFCSKIFLDQNLKIKVCIKTAVSKNHPDYKEKIVSIKDITLAHEII